MKKTQKQVICIRRLRQASGLTQSELGRLSGLNQQTVSDYEKNRRLPTFMAGRRMAKALGVSMDDLAAAIDEQLDQKCSKLSSQ